VPAREPSGHKKTPGTLVPGVEVGGVPLIRARSGDARASRSPPAHPQPAISPVTDRSTAAHPHDQAAVSPTTARSLGVFLHTALSGFSCSLVGSPPAQGQIHSSADPSEQAACRWIGEPMMPCGATDYVDQWAGPSSASRRWDPDSRMRDFVLGLLECPTPGSHDGETARGCTRPASETPAN
jgi:hypothetical protein